MRFWINLIFLLSVALAVIVGAQLYLNDPVRISYLQWSISPPASVAIIFLLLLGLLVVAGARLVFFLLFISQHFSRWRQQYLQKRNYQNLKKITELLVHGDKEKLLRELPAVEKEVPQSVWQYAQIAGELGKNELKMKWLQKATESSDAIVAAAAQAEIHLLNNELIKADGVLKFNHALTGPYLLVELYYRCSHARSDWAETLKAAYRLQQLRPRGWTEAVREAVRNRLHESKTADEAQRAWEGEVASGDKKTAEVLALYIATLAAHKAADAVSTQLRTAYKQFPNHPAVLEQVVAHGDATLKQQAFTDNEQRANNNDARLLELLVRLAEQLDLPGKAEQYRKRAKTLGAKPSGV